MPGEFYIKGKKEKTDLSQVLAGQLHPELSAAWIIPWGLRYLGSVAVSVWALNQTTMFFDAPPEPPAILPPP